MSREPKCPGPTIPERSRIMRAVGRRDTESERVLQSQLEKLGLQFDKHVSSLPGSPDLVFTDKCLAVFVHGCFWHRHEGCKLATTPKSNTEYWQAKFIANRQRDARKIRQLRKLGWKVLVVWQCQIKAHPAKVAWRIMRRLRR
jgi:DNA mismatch endonuclease (patch repair protein)